MAVDIITEHQMIAEALAKKEIAQKKLAVCYFSLIMGLEINQHQHMSYHKGRKSSNSTEWLLHACLYSFFCYVAWVTFGRKDLRDIQEEVGRLLYSDTFNAAVTNRTNGDSGMIFSAVDGSAKMGEADPKEMGRNSTFKHRKSPRRPALGSIVNQRSPLMVCLLPSPKERSPHLFLGSRARRQTPLQADHCDAEALTEELNQQLASVSFGILGKPLREFSHSTLIPCGEQKRDEDNDHEPGSDVNNNSEDHPGIRARGSRSSLMGPKLTGLARNGSTTHLNTRNFASTTEAVTSDTE
ncbi:protein phosphatase 1 regulatory subunit 36 [Pempheris klunzingeri]|uniref:protein phosphatase 1 regulatory subunit 36 n=1 Tax=Pempheris klunzingeri TaxID=3127111 RepID=UPI0039804071